MAWGICDTQRARFSRFCFALMLLLIASVLFCDAARATSYVYDANGRLRAVTNSSGESAEYVYDALGNLLAIDRIPANQLAVFTFVPNHGPVGTAVTIFGQGFAATPSGNVLRFNGTVATVASATSTQLTANVPMGATTGPISVTVGGTTATSVEDFILDANDDAQPPTIGGFSPGVADATTVVTVTGSRFATSTGPVRAGVNELTNFVVPTSDTQLAFQVSAQMGSGPVTVITAYGATQSAEPLIVVPTSIGAANVLDTTDLVIDGGGHALSIDIAGKYAAATFSAAAEQWLSLQFSALTSSSSSGGLLVTVYDSTGTPLVTNVSIKSNALSLHLPPLPKSGTYLVAVKPDGTTTALFSVGIESNPMLDTAAGLSISSPVNGQSKRMTFTATQSQNLGLGIQDLVVADNSSPASTYAQVTAYKPDRSAWANQSCTPSNGGCEVNLGNAPATGVYSLVVRPSPYGTGTLSFTATLSDDVVKALPANVATPLSLARYGQNGRLTFSGTAGGTVAVQIGGIATTPSGKTVSLVVYGPSGTQLPSQSTSTTTGTTFNLANLPATGTYWVYVDPQYGAKADLTAKLVPSGSAAVSIGGASTAISTTANGEYAYFSFTATQGQNLGLGIQNLAVTDSSNPASTYAQAMVYKPDGSTWTSPNCTPSNGGCDVNLGNAPATGVYSVLVRPRPYGSGTLSFTATLSEDVVKALPANVATPLSLARYGQNGRLTFSGTAGATVAVQIGGIVTTPSGKTVSLVVYGPDGSQLPSQSTSTATGTTFNLANLPATGTYWIYVDPQYGAKADLTAKLVPSGSAAVSIGGASTAISTTANGQYAYFSFTATQGQNLGLGIQDLTVTDSSNPASTYAQVMVYKPDGSTWASPNCTPSNGGCDVNLGNAPATGVYSVLVRPRPYGSGTLSFTATLSEDVVKALPANVATPLSLARYGQNGRLTFSGTAGATVAVQISGIATTPAGRSVVLVVYKPDGTQLQSTTTATGTTLNMVNLPVTGAYWIYVDPQYGAKADLSATRSP